MYGYDALGRLAGQEVDGVKTWFVYDGDRVIEERDDTGALIAAYYYGLYVDEVLRMDRGGQSYYFHQDDLYNVVAVSDINGALAERYEYGDYGLPEIYDPNGVPLDASAIGNPFLFTGRRWHPELQLYHYRTRFMDPVMGRFISRDTIGLYGDAANLGNPNAYVGGRMGDSNQLYGHKLLLISALPKPMTIISPLVAALHCHHGCGRRTLHLRRLLHAHRLGRRRPEPRRVD